MQRDSPSRRIDGIDCLRALAILYVLMNHVNMRLLGAHVPYLRTMPHALGTALVWQGQAGVQIFFAVSGFLITSTAIRRWGQPERLKIADFYKLRFARIVPLLATLLMVLSALHLAHLHDFVVSQKLGGLPAALLAALTLRVGLFEAQHGYLPGNWDILWSLSVEEMFYLVFPFAARFLRRTGLLVCLLAVFIVLGPFARTVFAGTNDTWQEYTYLGGMDAVAFGCLTAMLIAGRTLPRSVVRALALIGAAALIFCVCFSMQANRLGLGRTGLTFTLVAIATCCLIVASVQSRWQAPGWVQPVLGLGRRSYEIYLTHMFVVFTCFHLFLSAGKQMRLVPVFFLSVILLSLALGEIIGRWFTEPVNHRLRRAFGVAAEDRAGIA